MEHCVVRVHVHKYMCGMLDVIHIFSIYFSKLFCESESILIVRFESETLIWGDHFVSGLSLH